MMHANPFPFLLEEEMREAENELLNKEQSD